MAVRFADEIIVLSDNLREYFRKEYGRETVWIPNGVTKPVIREADVIKSQYSLEKDSYILFLGRLVPEKGVHYLINAFRNVATEKRLVIAGSPSDSCEYSQKLKSLAQGDSRILFTGFVQGALLDELYSNAWLYVLPSNVEGMPLSLLEAMSYGCCCLVSDIPECAEVIGSCGHLFPRGDEAALERKLAQLCTAGEEVDRMRREAGAYITEKYSWEETVRKTLEVYRGEHK